MKNNLTRENQENIYRELYEKHKGTPMAVSSESKAHKNLRYEKITRIIEDTENFSVHDIGMGLADLYIYLREKFENKDFSYSGSDILNEYVLEASRLFPKFNFFHRDIAEVVPNDNYDWVLLSGVFHQRRESTIKEWENFYQDILKNAFQMANKGLSFNFITPYVDFYQTEVYYCNLPKLLNFINDDLSRFFTINHDYALYEFTVYVYKENFIKSKYPQEEFRKYFKT